MEKSLFYPLKKEGLTTLRIMHDLKSGIVSLNASKEWGRDVNWAEYGKRFNFEHPLITDTIRLGHNETLDLFLKYDLGEYLESIIGLIKDGKHQGIECFYNPRKEVRFVSHMHSNTLGINNGYHAIRSGGIRRHEPGEGEKDVIIDGLNLSRAMSFKNAGAQLPFGGSKITVQCSPVDLTDFSTIGFLAYALDRTRSFTGPDMGFSPELADVMGKNGFSKNIACGFDSRIGPSGGPTAYGVYLAIKEAMDFSYGSKSLKGKTITVQGLGAVGYPLIEKYLINEGVNLIVSDILDEPVNRLKAQFPGAVQVVGPEEILYVEADVFVPCAMGGILDEQSINDLKVKMIFGGANNQLKATDQEEEIRLSKMLHEKGILFQVDWVHNAGGVIAGLEDFMHQENASLENVMSLTEKVCGKGVRENLESAKQEGITPTERAYKHYSSIIYNHNH